MEYIRQLEIVVGSTTMLVQDTRNGSQRMSANIEDWITDSKKCLETPVKSFPPCDEDCVCENGTSPITNGSTDGGKSTEEEKSQLDVTPCRRGGHSNRRYSFFAGIRYKYFTPHVDTEDLVKSTPSRLAGFFNRVLHVQKKHKFDGWKRRRSKTTCEFADDKPRLRSFRLFSVHREPSVGHAHVIDTNTVDLSGKTLAEQDSASPATTPRSKASTSTASSCRSSFDDGKLPQTAYSGFTTGDYYYHKDNPSSCEHDDPYAHTWSESSFKKESEISKSTDMNGFYDASTPIPRCFSESDVESLRVTTNNKTRTFTPRHSPQKTKHKKNWNIFSFFNRRGKEKHKT